MKQRIVIQITCIAFLTMIALPAISQVYFFSPRYIKESFNSELGLTFFTHFVRSPVLDTLIEVDATLAYPQPVCMRSYSPFTISYEPQFRLIEFGHSNSISLNVPIALAASFLDLKSPGTDGIKYDPADASDVDIQNGKYYSERNTSLGYFHLEFGVLGSYNFGRNSTKENTWPIGLNLAFGYNWIYGPLVYAVGDYEGHYSDYNRWGHLVGRFGMQFSRIGLNFMLGLNQTLVKYYEPNGGGSFPSSIQASVYHRMTMTIRLGK